MSQTSSNFTSPQTYHTDVIKHPYKVNIDNQQLQSQFFNSSQLSWIRIISAISSIVYCKKNKLLTLFS